ncbi:replicative DNA helicase [Patescibacteria group bacterium]|nr:replicative DNA helicase [Patescibacteria group bacterium]MBU1755004.1 replicative DNA helicase [Patescibacteria group bacterium]
MASSNLRVPPQSLEAERGLLGALLLKPDGIHDVSDIVRPDSFYAEKHKMIFEAMRELSEKSEPIDILTLSEKMTSKGTLERIGGRAYIAELASSAPSPGNFAHYAELVARKHVTRALIEAANDIGESCYDESRETTQLLDDAEKAIMAIGNGASVHKFVAIKDKIGETWDRIEALSKQEGGVRGTPTGFPELDNLLSGLHPSDLIILAARPSVGKTSFALDIARNAAVRHNVPVGIFSLEMSSEQIIDRMLSAESAVNSWKIRTGAITAEEDFGRIRDALEVLSKAPIFIDDKPGNNILAMRAVARRLKREQGIGLIIVDYLQLMSPTSTKGSDSMVQQVTEISRSLKGLARELDVPVLALSQLSRAVEQRGGKPRLSDLRDSGSIEQDADVVMFIHREDKGNPDSDRANIAEILIEKHRNGPTGVAELYFDGKRTTFMSVDKSGYGDLAGEF